MRKGRDGEWKKNGKWKNTSLAAPGALAHRLQHLTACFIQNGRRGPKIGKNLGVDHLPDPVGHFEAF